MALIARQNHTEGGTDITFASAAGGGDTVDNSDGKAQVIIRNGGGSSITVTVTAQATSFNDPGYGSITKTNVVRTVAAGGACIIGPLPTAVFNNASNQLAITYSGVTSVTIGAIKLP